MIVYKTYLGKVKVAPDLSPTLFKRYISEQFVDKISAVIKRVYKQRCEARALEGGFDTNSLSAIAYTVISHDDFYYVDKKISKKQHMFTIDLSMGVDMSLGLKLPMPDDGHKNRGYIAKLSEQYGWYGKTGKRDSYYKLTENPLFIRIYGTRTYSTRLFGANIDGPYVTNVKFGKRYSRKMIEEKLNLPGNFETIKKEDLLKSRRREMEQRRKEEYEDFLEQLAFDLDKSVEELTSRDIKARKFKSAFMGDDADFGSLADLMSAGHGGSIEQKAAKFMSENPREWVDNALQWHRGLEPRNWLWKSRDPYQQDGNVPYPYDVRLIKIRIWQTIKRLRDRNG